MKVLATGFSANLTGELYHDLRVSHLRKYSIFDPHHNHCKQNTLHLLIHLTCYDKNLKQSEFKYRSTLILKL